MAQVITLRLEGKDISAQVFAQKVKAFLDVLRAVDRSISRERGAPVEASVKWVIESIHSGSPIDMKVRADPASREADVAVGEQVIAVAPAGLDEIESQPAMLDLPAHFSWTTLEPLQDLVKPSRNGLTRVQVITPDRTVSLSEHASKNLGHFLKPVFEHSGSVEGVLQVVSVASGRPTFSIRDRISGRAIRCTVPKNLLPAVLSPDVFDHRVTVYGRVKTNERGDVLGITVEQVEAFPKETELPSIRKVAGAFDLTGEKTVSEHLDWLRDAS